MLYLINTSTETVDTYEGSSMLRPTTSCRAACCDIACQECSVYQECPHTTHDSQGLCVNQLLPETARYHPDDPTRLISGTFACIAFYQVAPPELFACGCATLEVCDHQPIAAQMLLKVKPPERGRPAGSLGRRLFVDVPAREEQP